MSIEADILRQVGVLAVRQIQRRIREGKVLPPTQKSGRTLYSRGALFRSIKYRTEGDSVILSAGDATVPYARIHHEGGVIRPKNAKYLAIPLTAKAKLSRPRDYPVQTFLAKGVIFEKTDGKPIPIYALKKQVTIPARPYMFLDDHDKSIIRSAVISQVERTLKGGSNAT
jgi:phage gpG-like protein